MGTFRIVNGRNIKIKGAAEKKIVDLALPKQVAVKPSNFHGIKPRLSVDVGSNVKVGTPIFTDKNNPDYCIVSPVSGKVSAINRGEKRVLQEIVVETDGRQEPEIFKQFSKGEIDSLARDTVIKHLEKGGLWPAIRQRPFSKFANPHDNPKAIFIHAMNTEPLALDVDFIINKKEAFQAGVNILRRLTDGKVHLCVDEGAKSEALTTVQGAEIHRFSGPHPAGNVSTHIHYIDPINKGEQVWYVEAQDVLRIAHLFLNGVYTGERMVAVTGEGVKSRVYVKTIIGAPISALTQGSDLAGMRCISGSVLTGESVGKDGYINFYDSQVTVIPEGGKREFLGWLWPGFNRYSFSKTFASALLPQREASLDTDKHGSNRAIVLNHVYDQYVPLDVMTYFLIKAVLVNDIDEAERLGILECDEEDFALASFACPSKTDVGGIIRQGLNLIEKEG